MNTEKLTYNQEEAVEAVRLAHDDELLAEERAISENFYDTHKDLRGFRQWTNIKIWEALNIGVPKKVIAREGLQIKSVSRVYGVARRAK